jgi:transcriptional regulator with XRE-family HTH domain
METQDATEYDPEVSRGATIRKWRKKAKLTQRELGEKVGVSPQAVSEWERNVTDPTSDNLERLAEAVNVSLGEFSRRTSAATPPVQGGATVDEMTLMKLIDAAFRAGASAQTAERIPELLLEIEAELKERPDPSVGIPDVAQLLFRLQTVLRRFGRK